VLREGRDYRQSDLFSRDFYLLLHGYGLRIRAVTRGCVQYVIALIRHDDLVAKGYYECTPQPCTVEGYPDIELSHALIGMTALDDYGDFLGCRRGYCGACLRLMEGPFQRGLPKEERVKGARGSRVVRWLEHEAAERGRLWAAVATVLGLLLAAVALLGAA